VINWVPLNQRAQITFGSKSNVPAFVFKDAEVTAADSNIATSSTANQNGGRETGNT